MKRLARLLGVALLGLSLAGCGGGGGGGGGSTVTGIVVDVETGGPPNPQASVQVGNASVLSDPADGSFSLSAPVGSTAIKVDTKGADGVWTYPIAATTSGANEDVGQLWVGPQRVTVGGQVLDSSTSAPVAGASVSFAGAVAKTDATGTFDLYPVAYPNTNFAAFWGIVGNVNAANYFANTFSTAPNTSTGGLVSVAAILLTPLSSTTPPNTPYNIWGKISPTALGAGCTVTLSQNGAAVRITTADTAGAYFFWIQPGTYTLHFQNGSHTTADQTVVVAAPNDVKRVDVQLS